MPVNEDAQRFIRELQLARHPEGGYYRRTYQSPLEVAHPTKGVMRWAMTHIYYLLPAGEHSALHRVASDEAWHFYDGDPLLLHTIDAAGRHESRWLGRGEAMTLHAVVPASVWQAAELQSSGFTLCGCTVAPGFDFDDFEMGDRTQLLREFPHHAALVDRLAR